MSSRKELILVDVDEVCARTIEDGVYPSVNAAYGTDFHHDTTYDYRNVFGERVRENGIPVTNERKNEIFNAAVLTDQGKNAIRTVSGSLERISELSGAFAIGMLTARHEALKGYTEQWARHHFGDSISRIHFSNCYHGGNRRKSHICREEGARMMIEDDMDYALEIANEGILVFLLEKPWNVTRKEKHRNIRRIPTWKEVRL